MDILSLYHLPKVRHSLEKLLKQHCVTGALELKAVPADERTFHIEIGTVSETIPAPGSGGTFLNMFVKPHAANLVAVSIRETKGVLLG